jgi:hypothetical protein
MASPGKGSPLRTLGNFKNCQQRSRMQVSYSSLNCKNTNTNKNKNTIKIKIKIQLADRCIFIFILKYL